jgi:type II secretory pathway pseudopilin PulG
MKNIFNKKGQSLIEIVIAVAIVVIGFFAVMGFLLFSSSASTKAKHNTEAVILAEQAMEAVRKLRDDSWSENIRPLLNGTVYYPVISSNHWVLSTTNPGATNGYTTTVVFSAVNRDANDNIASSGTVDNNSRKVVVTTSWNDSGSKSVTLTTYITNFNNN